MSDLLIKMPLDYEPKKKNRFLFRFPSDLGIQEWWVSSGSRPSITQKEVEIPFFNTSTWVLGRYTWDPISITFKDPIGPSAAQALTEWLRLGTESATGRQGYAVGYKRDVELELTDPTGVCVERWLLKNVMLTNIKYGDLDYNSDDLTAIEATMRMDYALLLM